ncbi:MAG: hypothetical protein H7Z20_02995 [Bdellovibrio sp.]|nr:hypothetical protein [Methylotenera sp.]
MDWNQIESNWKELKVNIQQQWAELTGSDLDNMTGNRDELTSKIQQTYSLDRQSAEKEVDTWQSSQHDFDDDNSFDHNDLDDSSFEGNDVGGNSNTMHTNKFGYDETSSNQIQSGNDNNTMPGTNNLTANATANTSENLMAIDDSANGLVGQFSANNQPYHLDSSQFVNGNDGTSIGNNSQDGSQGPGGARGAPGANEENGIDDDIDEINHPNPNPLPNEKTPPASRDNKTDHQEKSIDQT